MIKKDCDFCKKMREKILKKADQYVNFHVNVQKVLEIKKKFFNRRDVIYSFTNKHVKK